MIMIILLEEEENQHNDQFGLFIMFIVRSYNDDPSITIRLIAIPLILLRPLTLHNDFPGTGTDRQTDTPWVSEWMHRSQTRLCLACVQFPRPIQVDSAHSVTLSREMFDGTEMNVQEDLHSILIPQPSSRQSRMAMRWISDGGRGESSRFLILDQDYRFSEIH